ncbi:MAG: phage holin family protein [Alphaproteobacteria bacterium]|nr:phage holin family protein [Alphaproteobacteria bacterium]MCW5744006.1 phage holin family protein [Alphaproteobacteria bacterium]
MLHPRTASRRGVVGLASDAIAGVSDLVATEFALARAELGERLAAVRGSLVFLLSGVVLLIAALFFGLQAVVHALAASGMEPHWAALLVAGGSALVGGVLLSVGLKRFDPVPRRSLRELERDRALAEEHLP